MAGLCLRNVILPSAWGWPPALFAATIGILCEVISRTLSPEDPASGKPVIPAIVLALVVGCAIRSSPMAYWIGLTDVPPEHPMRRLKWYEGLGFLDKIVLRVGVTLVGFNIPPVFRLSDGKSSEYALGVAFVVLPINQLVAFFVVRGVTRLIRMDEMSRDMISVGTMSYGDTAVFTYHASLQKADADADADRKKMAASSTLDSLSTAGLEEEEKTKICKHGTEHRSTVFATSVSALIFVSQLLVIAFRPLSEAAGMPDPVGGLWAGLSSYTIAVASQFGEAGEVFASIAIVFKMFAMGPTLMLFGLFKARADSQAKTASRWRKLRASFPLWTLLILLTATLRAALDAALPDQLSTFAQMGRVVSLLVNLVFGIVTASVGLQIKVDVLLQSWKFMGLVALGAVTISASGMVMVQLALGVAVDGPEDMYASLGKCVGAGAGLVFLSAAFCLLCACLDRWRGHPRGQNIAFEIPATTPVAPVASPCALSASPCTFSQTSNAEGVDPRSLPTLKLGHARGALRGWPDKPHSEAVTAAPSPSPCALSASSSACSAAASPDSEAGRSEAGVGALPTLVLGPARGALAGWQGKQQGHETPRQGGALAGSPRPQQGDDAPSQGGADLEAAGIAGQPRAEGEHR